MITKYKNLGMELSQKEMKEIKGGQVPANTLWRCTDGNSFFDLCSTISGGGTEVPDCGISCVAIDTCLTTWTCIF